MYTKWGREVKAPKVSLEEKSVQEGEWDSVAGMVAGGRASSCSPGSLAEGLG